MVVANLGQRGLDAGTLHIGDSGALQVLPILRLETVGRVDQDRLDRVEAARPQHARPVVRRGNPLQARRRAIKAAGADVDFAGGDLRQQRRGAADFHDFELELVLVREAGQQVVFETRRLTVGSGIPRRGARPDCDDQLFVVRRRR